jgi:multidrug resistance efflux pump
MFKNYLKKFESILERRPLRSFLIALGILLTLIVVGNKLRKPKEVQVAQKNTKEVSVYSIAEAPKIKTTAEVEKSGVVRITSAMSSIVYKINVKDGQKVKKGTPLITLNSNYSGGNVLTLGRQLAEKQNQIVESTYTDQKDLLARQREIANQSQTNFEKMRDIANASIDDTKNIINLNSNIISTLNTNIQNLSADPINNAQLILATQQMLSQFQSANNQLNSALRSAQYQSDTNNPPSKLSDEQKNITLKQLDNQDKTLDLNRELSSLQLKIARVNESQMYPMAPSDGIVEQVLVREGQQVNPGTPILVFSSTTKNTLKIVAYLPKNIAEKVSKLENSTLVIGSKSVETLPVYVSSEAVNGNLYAVIFMLPVDNYKEVGDKEYIEAQIPIGYPDTAAAAIYVPLDSVYQTQDEAFVFILDGSKAKAAKVRLGEVFGSFVRVNEGLTSGDKVISDRNILDGDDVVVKN